MTLQLAAMWLIALGRGEFNNQNMGVSESIDSYIQPEYSGYQQGSPFDFGFTSPLETAPGTPLYGLENVGQPIDSPFFLGYSQRPIQLDYTPPPLEFR